MQDMKQEVTQDVGLNDCCCWIRDMPVTVFDRVRGWDGQPPGRPPRFAP